MNSPSDGVRAVIRNNPAASVENYAAVKPGHDLSGGAFGPLMPWFLHRNGRLARGRTRRALRRLYGQLLEHLDAYLAADAT